MKFTEYVQGRDDHIRRHVAYLATKHGETLEEAANRSMARIWQQMDDNQNHALISAFRGERPLDVNRVNNVSLAHDIRQHGWGYTPTLGGYREKIRDPHTDKETGEGRNIENEESYFITGGQDKDAFREQILKLVQKYEQESAIIKYADDPIAHFIYNTGKEEPAGEWKPSSLAKFYTRMRKGPGSPVSPERPRKFTFANPDSEEPESKLEFHFEAAGDMTRSMLMAVDKLFQD